MQTSAKYFGLVVGP